MAVVGEGTVVVRLVRNVFRRDLQEELSAAEGDADKSGERSGDRYSRSFGSRLRAMDDAVLARLRGLEGRSGDSGDASGASFGSRFGARLGALDDRVLGMFRNWGRAGDRGGDDSGNSFVSRFSSRLRGLDDRAASFFSGLGRHADGAGDDAGGSFVTRFMSRLSTIGDETRVVADDAGNALTNSFSKINIDLPDFGGAFAGKLIALIPLIGVLGGGLSALVGGLGAVAAAAVYAAGSLAVLASGVGALGLGLVTGFLAFSGIAKALGALNNQQKAAATGATSNAQSQKAAAEAIRAAQQRVQEAIYNLAQARKNASEQAVQDEHSVQSAEYALAQAQQSARDAQVALTQARQDAKSKLIDLQLQLRGSVLSEEEATLRLQKAQQDYQATLNNPAATAMDREQARLNLEEAELSLDEAAKRNQDLEKQAEDANKKGVEGSDQVVAAKKKVHDANHSVADAEYSLAQARQRQADDALKSQHDIARAIQEVANAQRAVAAAQEKTAAGGVAAGNAVKKAFAGMTPGAIAFAKYLFSLKPLLTQLQQAAGARLFGPLMRDIKALVAPGSFFDALKSVVAETSHGLAQFFGRLTAAMRSGDYLKNFKAFAGALTAVKNGFSDWGLIGNIIGNVLRAFTGLALAAEPLFRRLLTWLNDLTAGWAAAFSTPSGMAKMTSTLNGMGDAAATIFGTFGDLWTLLKDVFGLGGSKSGVAAGIGIIQDFDGAIRRLDARLKTADGIQKLQHYFTAIRGPIKAIGGFVAELAKQFLKLGENPKLIGMFNQLKDAMPQVEHVIETFTNKVAPALISIISQIIAVFDEIASSPAFDWFVGIMKVLATVIGGFIKLLFAPKIRTFTGALLGMLAALVAINKIAKATGLKALYQSVKVGAAPANSERAEKATGLGSFIQGVRGRRVVDPSTARYKETVDPGTGEVTRKKVANSESARTSNRIGTVFGRTGGRVRDRFRSTPPPRETPPNDATGDFFDPRPGEHTAPPRRTLRSRLRGPRGDSGFASPRAAGAVAAVATVGLALAPEILHGNIKGIKEAAKNIGHTLTDNMGLIVATAAPGIIGKLFSGEALGAVKRLGGIAKSAASGVKILGVAMKGLLGPWGLVIVGVVALVAGLIYAYKHWKPFRDIVDKVGRALKIAGVVIKDVAIKAFGELKKHLTQILPFFGPIGLAIDLVILAFRHMDVIKTIVKQLFSVLVTIFRVGMAPITLAVKLVKDVIVGIWNTLSGTVIAVVRGLWATIKLEFNTAKDLLIGIINVFKDLFTGKWSKLKDDILGIVRTLWSFVTGLFNTAKATLVGVGTAIWHGVSGAFGHMKDDVVGAVTSVWNAIRALPGKITGLLGTIKDAAKSLGIAIWNGIKSGLSATGSFATSIGTTIVNAIIDFINNSVIGRINSGLRAISIAGHRPFGSHTLPNIPRIGGSSGLAANAAGSTVHSGRAFAAATGATVAPRPGGTLVTVAEAGRPESIVDTGLINQRLRADAAQSNDVVGELRTVQDLLRKIQQMGGINVEKVEVQAHPDERASESVPRSLRALAFELGA